ncbi:MAG: hypothetical protein FJW14_08645 [Acidimicrobiia bacterium]|nr:hypothetical protein [Acidimicrobiia bacterium]
MRVLSVALTLLLAVPAYAEVTRVEITSRADMAFAGYERIMGRVFFAVDPSDPRNAVIADIDKAPRNAQGKVEFSADFYALRPTSGGNGAAVLEIVNRGSIRLVNRFGDDLLLQRGFTIVGVGWEFDLPAAGNDLLRIQAPAATDRGTPITGLVSAIFTVNQRTTRATVGDLVVYAPVDAAAADTTLTVRDALAEKGRAVPRGSFALSGQTVTMESGLEPGRIYELSYRAANPPVGGLGLASVRDFASWLRHAPDAVAPAKFVYAFGQSQSGRYLREFLYHGFNTDERDRQVFDAVWAHIAGAARVDINRRWSNPTAADGFVGPFPFADRAQRDPVTGATDGLLDNPRARRHQPKLVLTNSAVEYWIDAGRVAALTHTTPDGARDLTPGDNVRSYLASSAQHTPGAFPPAAGGPGQQRGNPVEDTYVLRALMVAMDGWAREGVAPPPSRHPRLADGTLVRADAVAFPAIPGVASPRTVRTAMRAANALVRNGAGAGAPLPLLVPQVDADGNDRAGIRVPEVAVPLATYTGWNFRNEAAGNTGRLLGNTGSYIPFARTKAEREQRGDPRPAIAERYRSREQYLALVRTAAEGLVRDRYMLQQDIDRVVQRAGAHWDVLMAPATSGPTSRSAPTHVGAGFRTGPSVR